MKRFRWTRAKYRHAAHLARFFARFIYYLPDEKPALLERYFDLWERRPQLEDPLLTPLWIRRDRFKSDDGIPF
jgi:hypothetical protein